jgi:hypothetical protein
MMQRSHLQASSEFIQHVGEPARSRLEEINRQTGASLPRIIEALAMRGIDDASPATLTRLFPDLFGDMRLPSVLKEELTEEGFVIRLYDNRTWKMFSPSELPFKVVKETSLGDDLVLRVWSDGSAQRIRHDASRIDRAS